MFFEFHRWLALTIKEFQQLRKNKQLLIQLLIPPTIALVAFGYALNPDVKNLRMGIVDQSSTPQSRELIDSLTSNQAFKISGYYASQADIEERIRQRDLDLGVIIPSDYARKRLRSQPVDIQVLIDAVNANTANLAQGYLTQAVASSQSFAFRHVEARSRIFFNPGSIHAWYFITGTLGVILFINTSLVSSAVAVREKEIGTIEQLLMSPAQTMEVMLAKATPVATVMMIVLLLGMATGMIVFHMPQRGSWILLLAAALLLVIAGIGLGITVATFSASQQQSQLLTFFLLPPVVLISGAFAPIEGMPELLQWISIVDPIKYMIRVMRGIIFKDAPFAVLLPDFAALAAFSLFLFTLSAWRYRKQLQ